VNLPKLEKWTAHCRKNPKTGGLHHDARAQTLRRRASQNTVSGILPGKSIPVRCGRNARDGEDPLFGSLEELSPRRAGIFDRLLELSSWAVFRGD
jgi:hypothetical protein